MTTGTASFFSVTDKESEYLLNKLKEGEKSLNFNEMAKKKYIKAMTEFERRIDNDTTPSVFSENKVYDGGRLLTLLNKLNSVTSSL